MHIMVCVDTVVAYPSECMSCTLVLCQKGWTYHCNSFTVWYWIGL